MPNIFRYYAFGLRIGSDIKIPELFNDESSAEIDIYIHQGDSQTFSSFLIEKDCIQGKPQALFLNIPSVAYFLIKNGREIIYQLYEAADVEELRLFLLGSCLGAILQQRGYLVLHGNAISFDKKSAIIFVGGQGAGKSTTALALMKQGAEILADDVCAVKFDERLQPLVIPSFPQIKIWQDTADFFAVNTKILLRLRRKEAKYALNISKSFYRQVLPIKKIVELRKEKVSDKSITGIEKLKKLMEHSYRFSFLYYQSAECGYIRRLAQLAQVTSMHTMARPEIPGQASKHEPIKLIFDKSILC